MNRWYWVKIAASIDLYYLVSASNKDRACFQVAPNSEKVTATLATWGSLKKYLHARIPRGYNSDSPAHGSIPIKSDYGDQWIHHSI